MGSITINAGVYVPTYTAKDAGFSGSSGGACTLTVVRTIYYDTGQYTFATTPVIWLNSNGTGYPSAGWYSLDAIARYWDGLAFTTSVACPNVSPISLKAGGTSVGACSATSETLYVQGGETFDTMTALYTDASLTVFAGNGYYSDGVNVREWQAPNMLGVFVCLFATPVLLGEGLTAGAACGDVSKSTFYLQAPSTFVNATRLYAESTLSILAPTGYYSDGNSSRYWDKVTFTFSPAVVCAAGYTSYATTTADDVNSACNTGVPKIIYILSTETFATATKIWNNSDGTGIPPINYYAYNGETRYWDGVTLTPVQSCPLPVALAFTAACDSGSTGGAACCAISSYPQPFFAERANIALGDVLYEDIYGATPVVGANLWYKAQSTKITYRIDNDGVVIGIYTGCTGGPYAWSFATQGLSSDIASCQSSDIGRTLYTNDEPLVLGMQMYTDSALTIPMGQGGTGNLWYRYPATNKTYYINNSGVLADDSEC